MNPKSPFFRNKQKNEKKDFHNWINKSEQVFSYIEFSSWLLIENGKNKWKTIRLGKFDDDSNATMNIKKNIGIKNEYLKINNVEKFSGFEFDHIVGFRRIMDNETLSLIESPLNLVYIDGTSHSKKTQKGSIAETLAFNKNDSELILRENKDIEDENDIHLKINENIKINKEKIPNYLEHNERIWNVLNKNLK